ncbi:MAG: exodeoxyribonuclease VII small subunit [Gammaproteobacteria bacterium]|nr:MAG: exodeoxyribonuclease VII small subunit [Gammaproteobacteria bacterium]
MAKKPVIDFEKALAELEQLVQDLEQGELPLEASLKAFERGIELTRLCQRELAQAEQKVRVLTGAGDDESLAPLDPPTDG